MHAAHSLARRRGLSEAFLICHPHNVPMRRIARKVDADFGLVDFASALDWSINRFGQRVSGAPRVCKMRITISASGAMLMPSSPKSLLRAKQKPVSPRLLNQSAA
jgi:hypothetical protein